MPKKKLLTEGDLIQNIIIAFEELSGDEIAEVYNSIVDKKIEYQGDNLWEEI